MTDLLDGIVEAALCASEIILDIYETEFDVEMKTDNSPVTLADQKAEEIILAHLSQLAPDIPVVAEESTAAGDLPQVGDDFFLVDPLDGTKEFVGRNGEFTVNIALMRNRIPTLGVIVAPVMGWVFAGELAMGAWRAEIGDPRVSHQMTNKRRISTRPAPETIDVCTSRSHYTVEAENFLNRFEIGEKKPIGSSLKFCLLAAGEADLYPRFSPTMEWDTAAGNAILSAAGGIVVSQDGNPLQYGKQHHSDKPFKNPGFIAMGDKNLK